MSSICAVALETADLFSKYITCPECFSISGLPNELMFAVADPPETVLSIASDPVNAVKPVEAS